MTKRELRQQFSRAVAELHGIDESAKAKMTMKQIEDSISALRLGLASLLELHCRERGISTNQDFN